MENAKCNAVKDGRDEEEEEELELTTTAQGLQMLNPLLVHQMRQFSQHNQQKVELFPAMNSDSQPEQEFLSPTELLARSGGTYSAHNNNNHSQSTHNHVQTPSTSTHPISSRKRGSVAASSTTTTSTTTTTTPTTRKKKRRVEEEPPLADTLGMSILT